MKDENLKWLLGDRIMYDDSSGMIYGCKMEGSKVIDRVMIADIRGYGAIQRMLTDKEGKVDFKQADKINERLGEFISDCIHEGLKKLNND